MYNTELKVNGVVVPLNEQMKHTLFQTCAGFTRSLKGVDDKIISIEITMELEE